ncbi:hypothetical protein EDB80DRAFT_174275 [Ilyonectria destructans]|nr:hypothetical protein EDB80DRAFT_174275 [Ilyonectria destructans]
MPYHGCVWRSACLRVMMLIDHLVVASWFRLCKIVLLGLKCRRMASVKVSLVWTWVLVVTASRRDARTNWKTDISKARYDDHGRPSLSPRAELCRSFPAGCPLQDLRLWRSAKLPHANYKLGSGLWWSPGTTVVLLKALAACVCRRESLRNGICNVRFHVTHSGVRHLLYSFSPDRSDCLQVFFPRALRKMAVPDRVLTAHSGTP